LRERSLVAVAYVLLSIAGLMGLMAGSVPFTVDFPNHAARLFIECNLGDPHLSRMYSVEYGIIPNLAIDLINQPLCGLVDPMDVMRWTMVAAMAGILLVTWKIHRLLAKEPNAFVLLAPAMTFNIVTSMGYLNYLIGTFLFLAFAWSMLHYRVLDRHPALAIVLPNLFGALLFFCHIFALGLAGVFLFGLRFAAARGQPWMSRTIRAGLMTAAGFILPLLLMVLAEKSGFGVSYPIVGKLRTIFGPFLFSNVYLAAALALVWLGLLYWSFRERLVVISPALRWPLLFLAIFSFLLPTTLLDATDLDSRCFVSIAYLALAAIVIRRSDLQSDRRLLVTETAAAIIAAGTVAAQLAVAIPQIQIYERQVAEFRDALKIVGPGSSLLAMRNPDQPLTVHRRFYVHITSYVTLDRKAFNPIAFTGKGMQPLTAKPEFACIDTPAGAPISLRVAQRLLRPETANLLKRKRNERLAYAFLWPQRFDYVAYYHFGNPANPFPEELRSVHEGTFFTLYRTSKALAPNGPCTAPRLD
jgi:hypothetical protein